ncbi:unnamed protein product [Clavelina lepadiformis]|uniref:Uncharacterized protein n=1 Tax=Clavelina lepadiformis TaxID=159417 RepID=A0ABP0G7E8_CLALP
MTSQEAKSNLESEHTKLQHGRQRGQKSAFRRRRKDKMAEEENYASLMKKIGNSKNYRSQVYQSSLDVILNRIESQAKDLPERTLLLYAKNLFKISDNQHEGLVNKICEKTLSNRCVLEVVVEKAENLAIKDVDGSSDPYCLLSVVSNGQFQTFKPNKHDVIKQTSVATSNLNPEWKESFELEIHRDDIKDRYLQVQVWDSDETEKKVKGMKGVGRYVTEIAQSVTLRSEKDDFLGFNSIPLSSVPASGVETWLKLRTSHSLQNVSGRIKLKLNLSVRKDKPHQALDYSDDVIYAGLLREIVREHFNNRSQGADKKAKHWDGKLSPSAKILLHEFEKQHYMHPLSAAVMRWEVYTEAHLENTPGLESVFLESLLVELDSKSSTPLGPAPTFSVDSLQESFASFIKSECKKIEDHRRLFSLKQENYVIYLGSQLLLFKKLHGMGLYRMVRIVNPNLLPEVNYAVTVALRGGTEVHYVTIHNDMMLEIAEDQQEENDDFGGREVKHLIKVVERLHKDILLAKAVYHGVFYKVLNIDYLSVVCDVIGKVLSRDVDKTMSEVNKHISRVKDPNEVDTERRSSSLFHLYVKIREIIEASGGKISLSSSSTSQYQDWFRPALLRWLQMSRNRTRRLMTKAVELDSVTRLDDIVKHTSSAVDTIGCLTGVVTFWSNLQWPDPVDAYTIALRLTDDMASSIESYADLIHRKLSSVGFFDDEGQFDVTEELCLALNNLQYVKSFLDDLPDKMGFAEMARFVGQHPEGPGEERVTETFSSLMKSAQIGMRKKINSVTSQVGAKMKPDVLKYLRAFAQEVTQSGSGAGFHENSDGGMRRDLGKKADHAIRDLMSYLDNNIRMLRDWLCEPNFRRILEVLWKVSLSSLRSISLEEFAEGKPQFYYQCRHVLNHHFFDFFHADGDGISEAALQSTSFKCLESELKMRCARTQDLIRLFYMQLFDQQSLMTSNPVYGYLNVHAYFDQSKDEIHLDVISANKLLPLDLNGLSDPFVQIRLVPRMLFKKENSQQTLVVKKTLDPIFKDESFVFSVQPSLAALEGTMLCFSVLDHDVISANDLEGEAVLPLNMLDGMTDATDKGKPRRVFALPLTLPVKYGRTKGKMNGNNNFNLTSVDGANPLGNFSKENLNDYDLDYESSYVISPLLLLEGRTSYDKDADEFCRMRKKQENAVEEDKIVNMDV